MSATTCPDCGRTTPEDDPCVWCTTPDPEPAICGLPAGLIEARRILAEATATKAKR